MQESSSLETSALHDPVWLQQLAEQLKTLGHSVKQLLTETDIGQQSLKAKGAKLPFGRVAAFFERAAIMTGDDNLGFHFGQTRDIRDIGLLGYVGLASPTVLDAVRNISRYGRIMSDAIEFDLDRITETGMIGWDIRLRPIYHKRQYMEFSVTNLVHTLRVFAGRILAPERVAFAHPRNTETKAFDRFFGCRVEFGTARTLVKLKLSDLSLPLMTADDRLLAILRSCCRDVLARHSDKPDLLIERVERAVVDRLASAGATLEVISTELGMSKRTLSRRLAELGTSFNAVVDNLRRDLAKTYLRDSGLSQTEIAFLLGYSEVSSFNTAFKRWTGLTPGQARRGTVALIG